MTSFNICPNRSSIFESTSHLLVEGGPGSGKTTIALLKAKKIIENKGLKPNQKILFLSFARATISRVEEQAKKIVTSADKKNIEINTYHGFAWSIIQAYGYLTTSHKFLKLITPPNLSARIAGVEGQDTNTFKTKMLEEEGVLCFDLFAHTATAILKKSDKICSLISSAYPYIIVDEFQDTDINEWELIQLLGRKSTIIALADLNQRIYEFRGASITRIPEFNAQFSPTRIDFGIENNRSKDTDIVEFGDDILTGKNINKQYKNVDVTRYSYYADIRSNLVFALRNIMRRVVKDKSPENWSIAILVKTKADTLLVSSHLQAQNINHEVLIDPAGPSLAAAVIARVLEPVVDLTFDARKLLRECIAHLKGRKGEKISKADLTTALALEKYLQDGIINGSKRKLLITEIDELIANRRILVLTGVPEIDWMAIRKLFQEANHEVLQNVYEDARYLRLLHKGAVLSEKLSEIWRLNRNYIGSYKAIEESLTQEHFSMTHRNFRGVVVMNIHKSKGKKFDEVIIWEEPYKPIVHPNSSGVRLQQDRLLLRVAVTRAKSQTTFLTPRSSPCILL